MTADSILEVLWAQGFTVTLVEGNRLAVSPASTLHDSQREILRTHKAAIVELLRQSENLTADLIRAAMRACDYHGDSPSERKQMRRECLDTPAHLQADLLDHFICKYGTSRNGGTS